MKLMGTETDGFVPVRMFYGYEGYCRLDEIRVVRESEMMGWEQEPLMAVDGGCADVMSVPKVSGVRLLSLYRGCLVSVTDPESEEAGWAKVKLADGRRGYIRSQFLRTKAWSQAGLWTDGLPQKNPVEEAAFRRDVMETAKEYLGVQYRWGGKSSAGIDCSGLTSVSYLLNGILIYRDALITDGYPVHEIPKGEMLPGDLMYFTGHTAMYLGNGKYIHAAGTVGSGGVVINSLNPGDRDYREDLVKSWYAAGSIF